MPRSRIKYLSIAPYFSGVEYLSSLCVLVLLLWSGAATAQRLYVYGPAGSEQDRRVMAVLEDRDGHCVPSDAAIEWSSSAGEVHVEEQAGPCVRWLLLRPDQDRDRLVLEAAHGDIHAAVTVPLDERDQLTIRAIRRGSRVRVVVRGSDGREELSGYVRTTDGEIELERERNGRLGAPVPSDGVLGIVVRSGTMVGVTALAPRSPPGEPQVLVLAADMAIEAGGPPREAAFVVVVDAQGRLSRTLPLNIESARGELRSLRWLEDGAAAIGLSAPVSVDSVDLSVGIGGRVLARGLLEVRANWPVEARLEVPGSVADGESFDVGVSGQSADGTPVDSTRLRVRCGTRAYVAAPFACGGVAGPGVQSVVVGASIDGRIVPLASRDVVIRGPVPVPVLLPPPEPKALAELALRGSLDLWRRGGFGASLRLWLQTTSWLRLGVGAEYTLVRLQASDQNSSIGVLNGIRHDLGVFALAEAAFGRRVGGAFRLALGGGYGRARVRIGDRDASGRAAFVVARVALGPRLRLGRFEVGADVGASFGVDLGHRAWERPWLTGFVEAIGAVRF